MQFHKPGFQEVTTGGTSAQTTSPVATGRVTIIATKACFANWGADPTAAASATSLYIPADTPIDIEGLNAGGDKFAFIQSSEAGKAYVYPRIA